MKRFRFPLRPVAILRAHQEMLAREAFGAAVQAFVRSEQALDDARAHVRHLEQELNAGRTGSFSAAAEIRAIADYRRQCDAEVAAEKAMQLAQEAMHQRRFEYLEAHRRVEVVQRLEEKARVVHRYDTMREEQKEFDDLAGRRASRHSLRTA